MAEPGLSELITTTERNRTGKLKDNVTNNNAATYCAKRYGGIEEVDGGRVLIEEMEYAENSTFQRYQGAQQLNVGFNTTLTAAQFEPKQFAAAVVINGRELRQNSGKEGIIKLLASRMKVAEKTLANNYNGDFLSDGAADSGLQIGGLKLLIAKVPTNTVGGINRSLSSGAFFRNYKLQPSVDIVGGTTTGPANIKQYYTKVLVNITRGTDKPHVILAGNTHYESMMTAMQAIQYNTDPKLAEAGFDNIKYRGIPVVLGGGKSFGGEALVPDDLSYFVNFDYLKLKIYRGANMEPLPEVQSINQDAKVQLIVWMGNATMSNGGLQAVLFDS